MTLRISKLIKSDGCPKCEGAQLTTFVIEGRPVSADREMTADELWDHYNGPNAEKQPEPEVVVTSWCAQHRPSL